MDPNQACIPPRASKLRRKRKGSNIGRHRRAGKQKSLSENATRATFTATSLQTASTPIPTVVVGTNKASDLPYRKSLRNRVNYVTRKSNETQEQVKTLLCEQSQQHQVFQEQLRDSKHIESKLKASLTTSEEQGLKASQVLSARAKRLSTALLDEKDKSREQKKKLKANIQQIKSVAEATLQQEKEERKVERVLLTKERNQEVSIIKDQYKTAAKTLQVKHRQEVSAILFNHSNTISSVKAKAKSNDETTKRKSAETLERSRRASTASRNTLKVRCVCLIFVFTLQV